MNVVRISHTIRPLDYKNNSLKEIFLYIDLINKLNIKYINFNIKMFEKINNFEIWNNLAYELKKYIDNLQMKIAVTHAPYENSLIFSNNISDNDLKLRIKKAIDVTKILGSNKMVIHSGISYTNNVFDKDLTIKQNSMYWDSICEYAKEKEIMLAFENDVVADQFDKEIIFKPNVEIVNDFVNVLKNKYNNVSICYDIGHGHIANKEILSPLQIVKDNISCFHIHNNYGKINIENYWSNDTHNPCYDGLINMEEFFKKLKDINYSNDIIIESVYRDSGLELENAISKDYKFIENLSELLK